MIERWHDFFVAEAGAAAALAGLLFVAVSINLTRILEHEHLPTRAIESLTALVAVLFVATFALVPDQDPLTYGVEIAGVGVLSVVIQLTALIRSHKAVAKHVNFSQHALMNLAPPIPFVIAGVMVASGHDEGLYWTVPGVVFSFLFGLIGAWVLLVEIQR